MIILIITGGLMIRITGGEAKGRALKVFRGGQVRPTSDKVRQAIFNILEHRFDFDFDQSRVLDLYAGSGSLGAEFLSRGINYLCAVESDQRTLRVLKDNLKLVQNAVVSSKPQVQVISKRVERFLSTAPSLPYQLIIADPPYKEHLGPQILEKLNPAWLDEDGIVVIEHEKKDVFVPPYGWNLNDRRLYGDTFVSFLSYSFF